MEWKIFSMEWNGRFLNTEWNGVKDFEEYGIWKIPIPFHFIAYPACDHRVIRVIRFCNNKVKVHLIPE